MSDPDPDVRKYLKKVLNSMMMGLLWLFVNSSLGIYFGLGLLNGKLSLTNILFYCWLILSLGLLLWYFYRVWRKERE